ncbi:MAG TPA: hypothetical protein VM532_17070 [Burkholderiales bacterium]|nr:hypothetical protein [Burkholderiales bacterium]
MGSNGAIEGLRPLAYRQVCRQYPVMQAYRLHLTPGRRYAASDAFIVKKRSGSPNGSSSR